MTTNKSQTKFQIGDRVIRASFSGNPERRGVITKISYSHRDYLNSSHYIYTVKFDDTGLEETGFLEIVNGLSLEPSS